MGFDAHAVKATRFGPVLHTGWTRSRSTNSHVLRGRLNAQSQIKTGMGLKSAKHATEDRMGFYGTLDKSIRQFLHHDRQIFLQYA